MRKGALGALICALALGCAPCAAAADPGVCEGEVISSRSIAVYATSAARVASVDARAGQVVDAGEALVSLAPERVYAHADGVAASVSLSEGDVASGEVLSVSPVSRYEIVCTVDGAYELPENMLPHMGQVLYAKCTRDGSHRAVARVTAIDGEYFTLEALGGELYVGETVDVYLSGEFESRQRAGKGTVIGSALDSYQASGALTRICVAPGGLVERGQLLFEYLPDGQPGAQSALASDAGGIVLDIFAQAGQALTPGMAVAEIAPLDGLRVSVYLAQEDASSVAVGDEVALALPWQEEDAFSGTVESVSRVDASAQSDSAETRSGLSSAQGASSAQAGASAAQGMAAQASAGAVQGMAAQAGMSAAQGMAAQNSAGAVQGMAAQAGMSAAQGMAAQNSAGAAQGMAAQAGMGAAQGASSAQGADSDGEPLYEVRIAPSRPDELRIGLSVTVDFGAD